MKKTLFLGMVLTVCGGLAFGQNVENVGDTPALNTNEGPFMAVDEVTPGNLYSNGEIVNGEFNGNDISILDTSIGLSTFGFNVNGLNNGYRMADDWENDANVEVDNMIFYVYQTGSSTASTITSVSLAIWDGNPMDGTSSIIWGDQFDDFLDDSDWTGVFRVLDTELGNTDRPIMYIEAGTPGLTLEPGTYWVDFAAEGTLASGPWGPPIVIDGFVETGNAVQWVNDNGAWQPLVDSGADAQQGFPFEVNGNTLGVNDFNSSQVSIYPTVTTMYVNVNAKTDIQSVTVFNMNGQQVMTQEAKGMNAALNVSSLPSGVYILKAEVDGQTKTFKFIRK